MAEAAIVVEDLVAEIGGRRILEDVSLACARGAMTAIVGPNGSGKTTLLRCLHRAVRPSRGRITIGGRPLDTYERRALARTVAVLRQEPDPVFDFTVGELVMMGRSPHKGIFEPDRSGDRAVVGEALDRVDLAGMEARSFGTLSGGEKQRVLLARCLAQRPEILLLDEPTNHLDLSHQLAIFECIEALGLTVVAALHDLNLVLRFASHVAVLDAGRVQARGDPEGVLAPDLIRRVFGVLASRATRPDGTHVLAVDGLARSDS